MKHCWRRIGLLALTWTTLFSAPVEAQAGLGSGVAQVALVVRVPPRGSIQGVSAERENGGVNGFREVSVGVRLSANTGYRLLVRRTGASSTRIWVRTAGGEFQELKADAAVTVGGDHRAFHGEREVHYRSESNEGGEPAGPLPVRYEIAVNPTL